MCDNVDSSDNHVDEETKHNDKAIVVYNKANEIKVVNVLQKGFNLHERPRNYLNRRTNIEEIIYHAVNADTAKSPYSSFKMACKNIALFNEFDVISGMRPIKDFIEMAHDPSKTVSIVVHRIGNTILVDEFDINAFLLMSSSYDAWPFLENFIRWRKMAVNAREFSPNALTARDLFTKFLYHTVGGQNAVCGTGGKMMLDFGGDDSVFNQDGESLLVSSSPPRIPAFDIHNTSPAPQDRQIPTNLHRSPDEFLRMAKWKIDDLSFLVGSDLAIFGTKLHPCISLRLSPLHEPINFLTGVDMWLENILNEVPEVAMCFHNEGIVIQEYDLHKTADLPQLAGFHKEQVLRLVKNLVMFLKENATEEGHTYWLVKEMGFDMVKLYDLTALCEKPPFPVDTPAGRMEVSSTDWNAQGVNPFVLQVATLCFKLAEQRIRQRDAFLKRRVTANPTDTPSTTPKSPRKSSKASRKPRTKAVPPTCEQLDNYVANKRAFLSDVLRLLKNCLNLISTLETHGDAEGAYEAELVGGDGARRSRSPSAGRVFKPYVDLKARALLLLCRLYLSTETEDIIACAAAVLKPPKTSSETVSVNVRAFASETVGANELAVAESSHPASADDSLAPVVRSKKHRLGDSIIEAFKSPQAGQVSLLAMTLAETMHPMLPDADMSRTSSAEGRRDDGPAALFWESSRRRPSVADIPVTGDCEGAIVAASDGGAFGVAESWATRLKLVNSMVPHLMANYALSRASRLWNRIRGINSALGITQATTMRMYECIRYSLIALVFLEHLIPDSTGKVCRFCEAAPPSTDTPFLPPCLLATGRRIFVLVFNCINDARKLRVHLPPPDSFEEAGFCGAAGGGGSTNALMIATLNRECPAGAHLLATISDASVCGVACDRHLCANGVSCRYANATECAVASWLSAIELGVDCIRGLLLRPPATPGDDADNDADGCGVAAEIGSMPRIFPLMLNDYMIGLRRYLGMCVSEDSDPDISARFLARGEYLYAESRSPLMDFCLPIAPDIIKTIVYTLRFQLVKLTIVKMPHLFKPRIEYSMEIKTDDPEVHKQLFRLQQLRVAIDELVPAFAMFSNEKRAQLNLSLLVNMSVDVLRTATEYSYFGIGLFYSVLNPVETMILENVAQVHRLVEKMIPYPLNGVLTVSAGATSSQQQGDNQTPSRRKAASDLPSRFHVEGLLSADLVRAVIFFRLHVAKVTVLIRQHRRRSILIGGRVAPGGDLGTAHKDLVGRFESLLAQMRLALTWLDRNSPAQSLTTIEDFLIYISVVSSIVVLQATQLAVLSEAGMMNILRDAAVALPAVTNLETFNSNELKNHPHDEASTDAMYLSESSRIELTFTLTQLGFTLNEIVQSLYTKASENSSKRRPKSSHKRQRPPHEAAVDDLKRKLDGLVAEGLDDAAKNKKSSNELNKWTRLVRRLLKSVHHFLNPS